MLTRCDYGIQFAQEFSFIYRRCPSVVLIVADFYDLTLRCIRTGKPCMSTFATQYFTDLEITLTSSRLRLSQKQKLQFGRGAAHQYFTDCKPQFA
jgi:hypothetical protein